jgi:selenocysteine lyase/cysteine desulfurase
MIAERYRSEFPTLSLGIHLLSHSLGPVPRAARESMLAYIDAWEHHTRRRRVGHELVGTRRAASAIASRLFSAASQAQCRSNQTPSLALATVASCFDFKSNARNKVVTTALDFPVNGIFLGRAATDRRAESKSFQQRTVSQFRWNESSTRIDSQTCLVALAHTSYRSSSRIDARAIVERAHSERRVVSAGCLPVGGCRCVEALLTGTSTSSSAARSSGSAVDHRAATCTFVLTCNEICDRD